MEGDHVYRVGKGGVLVHNSSVPSKQTLKNKAIAHRISKRMTDGKRNLGGIVYRKCGQSKVLMHKPDFPNTFVVNEGNKRHTEDIIADVLHLDADIRDSFDSIDVLLLFTERSPCERCRGRIDVARSRGGLTRLENNNGGSIQNIVYFVENGTIGGVGSAKRLAIEYGFDD